ncbi:unnamed protein product [Meganyctiphanes norvegica]|uniref:F-box domain-containing protein n=1 Tax=Meganyctiphanes norvegica TaxID=48144 RepID=A0AAV2QBF2_MEGNR
MDIEWWWSTIPQEIISHIFLFVPTKDLLESVYWVCKSWQYAIQRPSFWFDKMKMYGLMINHSDQLELINFDKQTRILQTVQLCMFLYESDLSNLKPPSDSLPLDFVKDEQVIRQLLYDGIWNIKEEILHIPTVLMFFRKPKVIYLTINSDETIIDILPYFLKKVGEIDCEVNIDDKISWRTGSCSAETLHIFLLGIANKELKCKIRIFRGSLQRFKILPASLEDLRLAIGLHNINADLNLFNIGNNLLNLKRLCIHIKSRTEIQYMHPLPLVKKGPVCHIYLYISNLSPLDIIWVCELLCKIKPSDSRFARLIFPSSTLTLVSSRELFHNLKLYDIKVEDAIAISSSLMDRKAMIELDTFTRLLGCCFYWVPTDYDLARRTKW